MSYRIYVSPIVKCNNGIKYAPLGTQHKLVFTQNFEYWRGRHSILDRINQLCQTIPDKNWNGQEYTGEFEVDIMNENTYSSRIWIVKHYDFENRKDHKKFERWLYCIDRAEHLDKKGL